MTLLALLSKEMRLSLRRERTVWVIVAYIILMGSLGWLALSTISRYGQDNVWSGAGTTLYTLLAIVQICLILFITPAFTATMINGEKERQTFDLLICSQLSSLELIIGKLFAGLTNVLLLISASIPLFSLVFFFGGISPLEAFFALVIFIVSALLVASFGLFCSTLFRRPAISTAIAYMVVLLWLIIPVLVVSMMPSLLTNISVSVPPNYKGPPIEPSAPALIMWSPIFALLNTYSAANTNYGIYILGPLHLAPWLAYTLLSLLATLVFFLLSLWLVKPNPIGRLQAWRNKRNQNIEEEETEATVTA